MTPNPFINAIIKVVIVGLIFWLAWIGLDRLKLPEMFDKIARALLIIGAVVYLINLLYTLHLL